MRIKLAAAVAAAVVLAGCGRSSEPGDQAARREPQRDTATAAALAGHDMAGMRDSTAAAVPGTMGGMEHGSGGDTAHAGMQMPHAGSAGAGSMAGMDHSSMAGMKQGAASGARSGGRVAGMDHSNMAGMNDGAAGRRRGGGAMEGTHHSGMAGIAHDGVRASGNRRSMAGMDHSGMAGMRHDGAGGRSSAGMAGMNHSGMAGMAGTGARAGGEHARMPGMDRSAAAGMAGHQGHAAASGEMSGISGMSHAGMQPGMRMGGEAARVPADAATAKLLELGSALVRDTAVQRRIREDPALRAGWSDPDVRRVIEGRP